MFDSHSHLQDVRIADAATVWARAQAAGVRATVLAGVDPQDWARQRALTHLPSVYQSLGLHPQIIATYSQSDAKHGVQRLSEALQSKDVKVVALGEIGIDKVGERALSLRLQREIFAEQLTLAKIHNLPVILHILRAHAEALEVLRSVGLPAAGGVVHSYSGSAELVARYVDLNLHVSFSGSVTWHADGRAAKAAKICPLERLLIETDAPDQTPTEYRPGPSEPMHLPSVARAIATARDEQVSTIATETESNACRLFGVSLR
jgi:TatD DNase family protein